MLASKIEFLVLVSECTCLLTGFCKFLDFDLAEVLSFIPKFCELSLAMELSLLELLSDSNTSSFNFTRALKAETCFPFLQRVAGLFPIPSWPWLLTVEPRLTWPLTSEVIAISHLFPLNLGFADILDLHPPLGNVIDFFRITSLWYDFGFWLLKFASVSEEGCELSSDEKSVSDAEFGWGLIFWNLSKAFCRRLLTTVLEGRKCSWWK